MNLVAIGYSGMKDAIARAERASAGLRGAFMGDESGDPVEATVNMILAKTQFQAAAAATRVANDMMGALLEIQAER
jgi:hypothetical protein